MIKFTGLAVMALGLLLAGVGCDSKTSTVQTQPAGTHRVTGAKNLTLDLGNGAHLKLVEIPAGKFLMGSPDTEKDRDKDELQHEVTISQPFYMGETHVTLDQYTAFVKDSGYQTDAEKDGWAYGFEINNGRIDIKRVNGTSWRNPGYQQQGDHPVVQVSWNDAQAFCDWLSKKTGKTVALPTEAQWEYAYRAGTTTAYPWGDSPNAGKGWGNFADQSLRRKVTNAPASWEFFNWDDGFIFTSPVGHFQANAFGLYDMSGNAWQWCQDRYGTYDRDVSTDPKGMAIGEKRVLRGGSWYSGPGNCRSAYRFRDIANNLNISNGFRVAVVTAGVD